MHFSREHCSVRSDCFGEHRPPPSRGSPDPSPLCRTGRSREKHYARFSVTLCPCPSPTPARDSRPLGVLRALVLRPMETVSSRRFRTRVWVTNNHTEPGPWGRPSAEEGTGMGSFLSGLGGIHTSPPSIPGPRQCPHVPGRHRGPSCEDAQRVWCWIHFLRRTPP